MASFKPFAVAALVLTGFCGEVRAETVTPWNDHPNSRVRLVTGEDGLLGVELQLAPGWKTYWRMPGDAGVPPSFEWTGSQNVGAFDVLFPAPTSMPDQGGTAVGYKGTVIFPVRYKRTDVGKPGRIALEFSYGVCKDICIPVDSKLTLDVSGAPDQKPGVDLVTALKKVPLPTADPAKAVPGLLSTSFDLASAKPHITFRTRGALDVFVEAPDGLFVPLTHKTDATDGVDTYVVDLSKSPDLKDLAGKSLRVTLTGRNGSTETAVVLK